MTDLRTTSRIFVTAPAMFAVLEATEWPELPENADGPNVFFGGAPKGDDSLESVIVDTLVDNDKQDWASVGRPGKDETFPVIVAIKTAVPGQEALEAWKRLEELAATAEAAFRDLTTGKPIIPAEIAMSPANGGVGVWSFAVVRTRPFVVATAAGFDGFCVLTVAAAARI